MWRQLTARLWKQTSVRHNFSANLVSKILSALVGLAVVPIYLKVLGVSGYGMIGIWTTLEAMATLLDLGLSPTMTREMATSAGRPEQAQEVRDFVRTLEVAYWALGFVIGGVIILGASPIADYWLKSSELSTAEVKTSVVLIGALILCRWPLSFYSAGLTGLERQVLLSWVTLAFTIVRSVGAVFVLVFIEPTILAFFIWQILINLVQTAAFTALLWRCLPAGQRPRVRQDVVRRVWRFAGGTTAIALVSMLLTNLDKVVVTKMLSLEEFGYYSLAGRIAATLSLAASPVFTALFPALARLAVAPEGHRLADLYHRGSQLMSVLIVPTAVTVVFFAHPLIFAWTGNPMIADRTWLIAALLTAGTAFNCIVMIPFSLQLAYGWTSLAFWTNFAYAFVTVPSLILLTRHFGAPGAAAVWLMINASYLVTQVPLMHRRLLRHEAKRWYIEDIGIPLVACTVVAACAAVIAGSPTTRIGAGLTIGFAGIFVGIVGLLGTPLVRKLIGSLLARRAAPSA